MALLTQLRLPAFKSVRDGRVDLSGLTIVAGRNGSGKSNVIDALAVLAALASGAPLRDALDGSRGAGGTDAGHHPQSCDPRRTDGQRPRPRRRHGTRRRRLDDGGTVTEFPNYFQIASRGSLGDSAIHDRLRPVATDQQAVDAVLAGIF